jgi:Pyruvate/2-oxoacid:ferredoxin oxidoreductase gamma subunit
VERELVMTGIGGQGIQLATQLLARAAIAEGRQVQLFGSYGGMMRGGNTEATVVIADGPIEAPPTVGHTWSAILMHHDYVGPTLQRVRPGSVLLVNTTVFDARGAAALDRTHCTVIDVPASDLAVEVGNVMTASMVMLGAYAAVTEIVALDALEDAVAAALPSYRAQHVALNVAALRAGHASAPNGVAPAWAGVAA